MSSINHRSSARRRRRTQAYHTAPTTSIEERLLQQAIENSKVDFSAADISSSIPHGPTFYPSIEEFKGNPLHYINKIRPIAEKYGICKIVPPAGWNPPFCVDMNSKKRFQTKEQILQRLQEGIAFGDGEEYNPKEYLEIALERALDWEQRKYSNHKSYGVKVDGLEKADNANFDNSNSSVNLAPEISNDEFPTTTNEKKMTPESLECDFWNLVEKQEESIEVEYGNDIDTTEFWSGFPLSERGRCLHGTNLKEKFTLPEPEFGTDDFYKETWWNLNNIPCCPDSILRHVKVGINGINVPWLYFGSLFSTFCWHNEDNYLYSINYHHKGSPKQWYGVPGTRKDAEGLERVFKNNLSMKMRDVPDLLHHITTMFSPRLLQQGGVPVYKLLQHAGEFVVTFPRSYHGGFSMGPNVGEAVNFATHDWIAHGADASERYRSFSRAAVFSHDRLTFTMANHHKEQQFYHNCILLSKELNRVIDEEMNLRAKLIESGVRDVTGIITLPKNRLDQLDEESADYDDKRLCHACKHVCFFSAVGCDCSHSKVSCLRHSQYMCRCPPQRKFLMIWSTKEDMMSSLSRVKRHCEELKENEFTKPTSSISSTDKTELPSTAPGSLKDLEQHKNDFICFRNFDAISQEGRRKYSFHEYLKNENEVEPPLPKRFKFDVQSTLKIGPETSDKAANSIDEKVHEVVSNDDIAYITTCTSSDEEKFHRKDSQ